MSETIVLLLAAVFAMAGVNKFRSLPAFRAVLRNLVPAPLVNASAILVPLSEVILAVALLIPTTAHVALVVAMAMLGLFTVVLITMKLLGIKGCACFGEQPGEATVASGFVRNFILIGLAAIAHREPVLSPWRQQLPTLTGELTVVLGALCLWPCIVALVNRRHLLFNWRPQQ